MRRAILDGSWTLFFLLGAGCAFAFGLFHWGNRQAERKRSETQSTRSPKE